MSSALKALTLRGCQTGAPNPLIQCEPCFSTRRGEHDYHSPKDGGTASTPLEKENKGGGRKAEEKEARRSLQKR